jgi:hypothetical protein
VFLEGFYEPEEEEESASSSKKTSLFKTAHVFIAAVIKPLSSSSLFFSIKMPAKQTTANKKGDGLQNKSGKPCRPCPN